MKEKVEIERPVIKQILKEINRIDKLNREWKEGAISEYQFSEKLDRLLVNIKRYQPARKHRKKNPARALEKSSK